MNEPDPYRTAPPAPDDYERAARSTPTSILIGCASYELGQHTHGRPIGDALRAARERGIDVDNPLSMRRAALAELDRRIPTGLHAAYLDLDDRVEFRIVAGILERRRQPGLALSTPFVAPETLLALANRAGERVERIGGASVEIYTPLGWLRVFEHKSLAPGEIMFGLEPRS